MPQTTILLFREAGGGAPLLAWLEELEKRDRRGYHKCLERILSLERLGHELRRPTADLLRDGVYELRAKSGRVQHRVLYFFSGRNEAVLSHGLTKEGKVDPYEIDKAVRNQKLVAKNKNLHTASWDQDGNME